MKGRNLILLSILIMAAGIVLLLINSSINSTRIVITGGILFICAGIFNILASGGSRDKNKSGGRRGRGPVSAIMSWFSSAAALILGICMVVFQGTFAELVPVMFGILIAFAAFYQLYVLTIGVRPYTLPAWLYVAPAALAGAAVYLFFMETKVDDKSIVLTTAIALILFGVFGIIEGSMLGNLRRKGEAQATTDTAVDSAKKKLEKLDESTPAPTAPVATEKTVSTSDTKSEASETGEAK